MICKYRKCMGGLATALLLLSGVAIAGDSVNIRLVEATNQGTGISTELQDVASLLQKQLRFSQYNLLTRKTISLPASQTVHLNAGIVVDCNGPQQDLKVVVSQSNKKLLQTTVSLKDGKPLFLGGFPFGENKLILILSTE